MLFSNADLERIRTGEVDLAFRRWRRPMHVAGGRQRTRVGVVEFVSVTPVSTEALTEDDARRAGTTLERLLAFLARKDGEVYRVEMRYAGEDERVALRTKRPGKTETAALLAKLADMDRRSRRGPWTREHLELIEARPGELAETIAASIGREKKPFKADVRRLKELGLTESLPVGYRLSPRGRAVLRALRSG
ncbi:hypothetical protein J2S40_002827 [Nocardioides luteus]|uniref:ASCH domain-containing protein n=1 Tax=Nocardioides luteus TaxID=1844 RepID=A0ABQ5SYK6_9ACTN|nr:hypothetical protein [Nocardioides luteus]MDR7311769.1 hypothetical protein [Nocardioides luteus]GGR66068.1 hypothetical protein GCM10010197_37000 [Nocardioides luteus]GLJ68011.1 hypothetical protein GCM10017579_20470 [Nocardioides luteus]